MGERKSDAYRLGEAQALLRQWVMVEKLGGDDDMTEMRLTTEEWFREQGLDKYGRPINDKA